MKSAAAGAGTGIDPAEAGAPRRVSHLARLQELVLRAVLRLGPDCTVEGVRSLLEAGFGHRVAFGAVVTTLDRLQAKGMVSHGRGLPTPRRGGRAPRLYRIQAPGLEALAALDRLARLVRPPGTPEAE